MLCSCVKTFFQWHTKHRGEHISMSEVLCRRNRSVAVVACVSLPSVLGQNPLKWKESYHNLLAVFGQDEKTATVSPAQSLLHLPQLHISWGRDCPHICTGLAGENIKESNLSQGPCAVALLGILRVQTAQLMVSNWSVRNLILLLCF